MRKVVYSFLIFGALTLAGCTLPKMVKMSKEQQLTVTPNPLEVHKDTVVFDMAANLPVKMLKKGTVYTVNTFYKYGDRGDCPMSQFLSRLKTIQTAKLSNLRLRRASLSLTNLP